MSLSIRRRRQFSAKKQNLGRIRSRGVERLDTSLRVSRDIHIPPATSSQCATVVNYAVPAGAVSLLGKQAAQVPRNVFTWQARYWSPSRLLLSVQGRFIGNQFDDDQNRYPLGRAYTMDLQIGRKLSRNLEVFAAAENILNQRYNVANTPFNGVSLLNLGPPILYRVGIRLNFPTEGR